MALCLLVQFARHRLQLLTLGAVLSSMFSTVTRSQSTTCECQPYNGVFTLTKAYVQVACDDSTPDCACRCSLTRICRCELQFEWRISDLWTLCICRSTKAPYQDEKERNDHTVDLVANDVGSTIAECKLSDERGEREKTGQRMRRSRKKSVGRLLTRHAKC